MITLCRCRRFAPLLATILVALLAPFQAASACGTVITREGTTRLDQERALIRWDGHTEDLVMEFNLPSTSPEAAWLVPVPGRADVRLAHPQLFDALQTLTTPRIQRKRVFSVPMAETGSAGGAGTGVTLLERQTLGPFEVSTLAARDAAALQGWLQAHDYPLPAGLATTLQPYVDRGWLYVAVRLSPQGDAAVLRGQLDPLWVSFASDQIIYPLRMTGSTGRPLSVFLYVLADHRVTLPPGATSSTSGGYVWVPYANWIEPATSADSPLAAFVTRRSFLTKFEGYLYPDQMQEDWVLPLAAADDTFHAVQIEYVYTDLTPYLGGALLLLTVLGLLGGAAAVVRNIRHKRRVRRLMEGGPPAIGE